MKPTTDNIFTFLSTNMSNFLCGVFSSRLHKDRNYVENINSLFKIAFGDDKQFTKVDPFRVFADRVSTKNLDILISHPVVLSSLFAPL